MSAHYNADSGLLIVQMLQKISPKVVLNSEMLGHVVRPALHFRLAISQVHLHVVWIVRDGLR